MGGRRCLAELQRLNSGVKVIIASGYAADGHSREVREAGARGFVGKPYDLSELLRMVREVLDAGTP